MLVVSGPAWRSFIQIYRERPDTGGKHSSALKMINSLQHQPKPIRVTSCFNLDPFLRLLKVWPACPDLGWRQRGHIAANSALPLHLSRWYPAKAAGLFRQAPAPAESLILKFKPRVNFLFFHWLWDKLPVFPISNSIPLYWESTPTQVVSCHSVCVLCCSYGSASASVAELGLRKDWCICLSC